MFTTSSPDLGDANVSKAGESRSNRDGDYDSKDEADEEADDGEEGGVRLPSITAPSNASTSAILSNKSNSPYQEPLNPQQQGQRRAKEREMVRQAARRGVAFGFATASGSGESGKRKAEAVQDGRIVEASFAKGGWGVRWRD